MKEAVLELGERWDMSGDAAVCGDLMLSLDKKRPTVMRVHTRAGDTLFKTGAPHPGDELSWVIARLDYHLMNAGVFDMPDAGLGEWWDHASATLGAYVCDLQAMEADGKLVYTWGRTAAELLDETPVEIAWDIPAFGKRGWCTLLAGREKRGGKSTLAFYLVGKLERGETSFLGPVTKMRSLIVTEEPVESITEKLRKFGIRDAVIVYTWELAGHDWSTKLNMLSHRAVEEGCGLILLDPISRICGVEDEASAQFGRAVELACEAAKQHDLMLWVLHHHRKQGGSDEDMSRGHTSVPAAADVIVNSKAVGSGRVRRLKAYGRVAEAHWVREISLSEDGTEYVASIGITAEEEDEVRRQGDRTALLCSLLDADLPDAFKVADAISAVGTDVLGTTNTARTRLRDLVAAELLQTWTEGKRNTEWFRFAARGEVDQLSNDQGIDSD